jgi:ArsR family transcriptional regulator, arsenate/arsenite/antimonite-responsive transcriptional repressor / arsenate reductase (thioredoxin)
VSAQQACAEVAPQDFLQLAGHPLRWRLLAELARSDRMVGELTGLLGEPQNLVSYHLGKLRDGRLVSARRSSADGRDAYYTADLTRIGGLLSASGGALHPGLRLTRAAPDLVARRGVKPVKVLFLCTGNSARSQMAEALANARSGGVLRAYSAGSQPKPLHPNALRVMREEHGLDLTAHVSKHLDVFVDRRFDWVISLCDRVREVCPQFPGHPETIHWSIANPAEGEADDDATYPLFQQTAAELATRIGFLLAALGDRTPTRKPRRSKS